ncbi:uncharacterized protein LOC132555998 [Ylistrum balloti]|uniref:uncharacterized protein LOC132555998 n=1 Tax=Ylistrum balloti TaxID=509963 RepID=UPI002905CC3D|nr:uncharacterized protein LOC132555998 [Ylistrum balloti]
MTHIFHLLDDFLVIDQPHAMGERTMALLCMVFRRLKIPLSVHKTIGSSTTIEYLGITLDSEEMQARLPPDKVTRILHFLRAMLLKSSCTKRELQQLLGHLNFAMRVILAGRTFVSYLLTLMTAIKEPHHHGRLSRECKKDIRMWIILLQDWNGVSFFYDRHFTSNPNFELFTDAASTIGFGGYFQSQWFASLWPRELVTATGVSAPSMSFLELYPIVVAALIWGKSWSTKRILFHCDNKGTVDIINKGRSKSPNIMSLMRRLTWCAATYNFTVNARHVPGVKNTIADALSRFKFQDFRRAAPTAASQPCPCPDLHHVMWD